MIPKDQYINPTGQVACITYELLTKYHTREEVENFNKWMQGQTGIMLDDGSLGIYSQDYERWNTGGRV